MIRKFLTAYALGLALIYAPLCEAVPFGFWKAAAASGFNPQTQGTLVNWYDASTLGLSNGANIVTFTDSKTGNPNPLTTSASNPTYATNQKNGLSTASLVTGQYFTTGGSSASIYPYTIAAVVNITSNAGSPSILGPSATGGLQFRVEAGGDLGILSAATTLIGSSTSALASGSYHLVVVTINSSSYAFYIDGVAAGSGANSTSLAAATAFLMGARNGSNDEMDGFIGEVQIYSSVLSSGDLAALHTYIVSKWATP